MQLRMSLREKANFVAGFDRRLQPRRVEDCLIRILPDLEGCFPCPPIMSNAIRWVTFV
jgi:hypothetical protein